MINILEIIERNVFYDKPIYEVDEEVELSYDQI